MILGLVANVHRVDDWLMAVAMTVNTGWFYTLIMCKCFATFRANSSQQKCGN